MTKARAKITRKTFRDAHVNRGLRYARDVVDGKIAACKWVRLACKRQLDDLERSRRDPAWPFYFDEGAAGRAARFLEQLPHTQGPLSFQHADGAWNRLVLEPWQCFIVTTVYGWIRRDSPKHRPVRRFARAYEELPRGNGKSFKLSGALLYSFAEGEQGVEAYSAAVDKDQAAKVYGEARAMLEKHPDLARTLGVELPQSAIIQRATHSRGVALSREAKKTGDGKNIYFAAVDELHAHPTREVWDVLDTGTGKRGGNAIIWIITTSGFDSSGVCYEKRDYVTKILEGTVVDDVWFGIIYTLDDGDDWTDEACRTACTDHSHPSCTWRKANPNWGVSVDPIDFESKAQRAIAVASEQNGFKTKHLDLWCSADVAWMDMAAWDKCADPLLREESFAGAPCVLGLDLATKTDLVAKAKLFYRDLPVGVDEEGKQKTERHFYLFVQCYLPEHAARASRNAQYSGWVHRGFVRTTPGDVIDFDVIKKDITTDASRYHMREVAFDPWQAQQLANELQAKGYQFVQLRPIVQNFSEPMKEWDALVRAKRFHHTGNPAMRWMVSNVVCHRDAKDNIYPRKLKDENKIDGPVATIMALNRALLAPANAANPYETRGLLVLG